MFDRAHPRIIRMHLGRAGARVTFAGILTHSGALDRTSHRTFGPTYGSAARTFGCLLASVRMQSCERSGAPRECSGAFGRIVQVHPSVRSVASMQAFWRIVRVRAQSSERSGTVGRTIGRIRASILAHRAPVRMHRANVLMHSGDRSGASRRTYIRARVNIRAHRANVRAHRANVRTHAYERSSAFI